MLSLRSGTAAHRARFIPIAMTAMRFILSIFGAVGHDSRCHCANHALPLVTETRLRSMYLRPRALQRPRSQGDVRNIVTRCQA